jgi:hypothetical protein
MPRTTELEYPLELYENGVHGTPKYDKWKETIKVIYLYLSDLEKVTENLLCTIDQDSQNKMYLFVRMYVNKFAISRTFIVYELINDIDSVLLTIQTMYTMLMEKGENINDN